MTVPIKPGELLIDEFIEQDIRAWLEAKRASWNKGEECQS